ncbi:hypothetical protein [Thermococcus sp.]
MSEAVKDSVEVALELDERGVYSHIAKESAEDIRRIISSIDAERAQRKGFTVYYLDDWDDLIRERIRKGKRHTAFDFYNPALLDIWEEKVGELRRIRMTERFLYSGIALFALGFVLVGLLFGAYLIPVGLSVLPLWVWVKDWAGERRDLIYHQLTQFFIDEMRALIEDYNLNPEEYRFKLFNDDYFGVSILRFGRENFAVVSVEPGKNEEQPPNSGE